MSGGLSATLRRGTGLVASAVAVALAAAGTPAAAADPGIDRPLLRQLLRAEVAAGMPGAFGQVRDGEEIAGLAAGVADVRTGRPVRPGLRHRVGSITKTFVAVTVLRLAAQGRVRLDAPVADYLPELLPARTPDGAPARGARITVRMLLQHTSGIANYTEILGADPATWHWARRTPIPPTTLAAIGLGGAPVFAPGTGWSYSNTNYVLAGLVVEKVTGRPYAEAVRALVIRPLKLRDTYLPGGDPTIRGPHARAYLWDEGRRRDVTTFQMAWAWAAGELISTPADLNLFFRALLRGRLLPAAQQEELLRMAETGMPGVRYGLGVLSVRLACPGGDREFYGHNGAVLGQWADSLHSRDGRRQVSTGENQTAWATQAELERVVAAKGRFQYAALCAAAPDGAAADRTAAARGDAAESVRRLVSLSRALD